MANPCEWCTAILAGTVLYAIRVLRVRGLPKSGLEHKLDTGKRGSNTSDSLPLLTGLPAATIGAAPRAYPATRKTPSYLLVLRASGALVALFPARQENPHTPWPVVKGNTRAHDCSICNCICDAAYVVTRQLLGGSRSIPRARISPTSPPLVYPPCRHAQLFKSSLRGSNSQDAGHACVECPCQPRAGPEGWCPGGAAGARSSAHAHSGWCATAAITQLQSRYMLVAVYMPHNRGYAAGRPGQTLSLDWCP
jgi:hypothetical protein